MKNILITGGTGYIGRYLTQMLESSGYNVVITSRNPRSGDVRCLDLLKPESIKDICRGMDAVVHLANFDEQLIDGNPRDALLANAYATRLIYEDADKNGVSDFIYFSTFHVYGLLEGTITELSETHPRTDYGLTHLFAEKYLEMMSMKGSTKVKVMRLSNGIGYPPEGCDKWYLIMNDCCKCAVEKQKITLKTPGYQKRNFVAITDVCSAVQVLLETPANDKFDIFNVGSLRNISIRDAAILTAQIYKKLSGKEAELVIPEAETDSIATAPELDYSTEKIRKLGWHEKAEIEDVVEDILRKLLGGSDMERDK